VLAKESGAQAIGVETEERINDVLDSLPEGCGVQGNLDPVMLLASEKSLREEVRQIVKSVPMERHIFNLGHGIRQQTPPEHITAAITEVRLWDGGGR
jgi:uroporphyrinogen decarboxylase